MPTCSFTLALPAKVAALVRGCCIESGDDLDPESTVLPFGRVVGVGGGGRLTGVFFFFFFFVAVVC